MQPKMEAPITPYGSADLLARGGMDQYAGEAHQSVPPELPNLLNIPAMVTSLADALSAMEAAAKVCRLLLERAAHTSSSSMYVQQLQVIEIVGHVFIELLPVPELDPATNLLVGIWGEPITKSQQKRCLEMLHQASTTYASVWQAMEHPKRRSDSVRAIASMSMLAIFDAVMRVPASDNQLLFSDLVNADGGWTFSTSVCQNCRPLLSAAATMEIVYPAHAIARRNLLRYFEHVKKFCSRRFFEFRQPDKIEFKKYSGTITFLRRLMDECGYELFDRDNPQHPPEMEALMEWLLSDSNPLAEHESGKIFKMARDVALLSKWMITMETREMELLRRREGVRQWQNWRLSFDDGGARRFGRRAPNAPLRWEVTNFRGSDMSTADVEVHGPGMRSVRLGEGLVVQSPCDLSVLIERESATEEDVLHVESSNLPKFDDTLSNEESEQLMSYLTVPYMRLPLVSGFFASQDRVMYLFNDGLLQLFRAVLFEGGAWVDVHGQEDKKLINRVPLRVSELQKQENAMESAMDARVKIVNPDEFLGTPCGLLLNEIQYAPQATLGPIFKILQFIAKELMGNASVYSPDATFILSIIELALDVEQYIVFALENHETLLSEANEAALSEYRLQMRSFLGASSLCPNEQSPVSLALERWRKEAEQAEDIRTACVVHSFVALLFRNVQYEELVKGSMTELLGSMSYVRNWHGFGLGQQRSDMSADGGDLTAAQRMKRFLQSRGIKTENGKEDKVAQFLEAKNRPVWLHIGNDVIRAPNLFVANAVESGDDMDETTMRVPPADVPEFSLFSMWQKHRRKLITWFDVATPDDSGSVLTHLLRTAMRRPELEAPVWQNSGSGRFTAVDSDLTIDIQTAEILWRSDGLRPLPDSMTQFGDFETLFGRSALHCGIVATQKHRHWVHVVGTDYELMEWDAPKGLDIGVGGPEPLTLAVAGGQESGWNCPQCTMLNWFTDQNRRAGQASCSVCGFAKDLPKPPKPGDAGFVFEGVRFDKEFKPYAEQPNENEPMPAWANQLLMGVVQALFPPDVKAIDYKLFQATGSDPNASHIRLLGLDTVKNEKRQTWKEVVASNTYQTVECFNLVSSGRRLYRSLVYSTNVKFSLHGLPVNQENTGSVPPIIRHAGGNFKQQQEKQDSLVITRAMKSVATSENSNEREMYLPPRLLQGIVPSVLLESFQFWQDDDRVIRGEPHDAQSQFFNYALEIHLFKGVGDCVKCTIRRRALGSSRPNSNDGDKVAEFSGGKVLPVPPVDQLTTAMQASVNEQTANPGALDKLIEDTIPKLVGFGFSYPVARAALLANNGNDQQAMEWILNENNATEIAIAEITYMEEQANVAAAGKEKVAAAGKECEVVVDTKMDTDDACDDDDAADLAPVPLVRVNSSGTKREHSLQMLQDEGHSLEVCLHALSLFGDSLPLAKAWLEDDSNQSEIRSIDGTQEGSSVMEDKDKGSSGELVLFNMLDVERGSVLHRFTMLLTRIENLSHILVWSAANMDISMQNAGLCAITLIELPRLKLRLQPRLDKFGNVRLDVLDHAGWFVSERATSALNQDKICDRFASDAVVAKFRGEDASMEVSGVHDSSSITVGEAFLNSLLQDYANSLLLENDSQEIQLLVTNHDLFRPQVRGDPFSTQVSSDRDSAGWLEVMDTRYFLFPVHSSQSFLIYPTLGSTLYLVLSKFLKRKYTEAMKMCKSCFVDVPFSMEEQWIFSQLGKVMDDYHPDAHAIRLRLSLMVQHSTNKTPWEVHPEFEMYLQKLPHVSADCRLSHEDEAQLLKLCKSSTPRLKNHLAFLASYADESIDKRGGGAPKNMILKPEPMRWGGQPWNRLCTTSPEYLEVKSSVVTRIRYKRPGAGGSGVLMDKDCVSIIWDDMLICDEESGANQQLGMWFLYELTQGSVQAIFKGKNVSKTMSQLLTRYFHLKLVRWGRETKEEGEEDGLQSKQMAQLAAVQNFPHRGWPVTPADPSTALMLQHGMNLYSAQGRESMVFTFMELLQAEFAQAFMTPESVAEIARQDQMKRDLLDNPLSTPLCLATADLPGNIDEKCTPLATSNLSCSRRKLNYEATNSTTVNAKDPLNQVCLSQDDFDSLRSIPLKILGLEEFIAWELVNETRSPDMLVDLTKQRASKASVAADLLERLKADMKGYYEAGIGLKEPRLQFVTLSDIGMCCKVGTDEQQVDDFLASARGSLSKLEARLVALKNADLEFVKSALQGVLTLSHEVSVDDAETNEKTVASMQILTSRLRFLLLRSAGRRADVDLSYVTASLMSTSGRKDILSLNPFLPEEVVNKIIEIVPISALKSNRIAHTSRCIGLLNGVQALLRRLEGLRKRIATTARSPSKLASGTLSPMTRQSSGSGSIEESLSVWAQKMTHASTSLASALTSGRHYVGDSWWSGDHEKHCAYDPRFLMFEYVFDLLLRPRQVEMVRSFVDATNKGQSRVQQMIMGAGKTTVIGPLLTLILADGKELVTQVMPSALMEQSRNILRSRFSSSILLKQVHTLSFDRSCEDSHEIVDALFMKLDSARRNQAVICATPEAIKSLTLKFIELLHSLEEFDMATLQPNASTRNNKDITRTRNTMMARSQMADSLVRILHLWKSGVLVMDEVDVLLHPLRSELNFPIGHKQPIDLAPDRWELPIFVIDSIFSHTYGHVSEQLLNGSWTALGSSAQDILDDISKAITSGYKAHALQKEPHIVLLDPSWYRKALLPEISKWILLWIKMRVWQVQEGGHGDKTFPLDDAAALAYLRGDPQASELDLTKHLQSDCIKLLNLASDWVVSYLPHCLAKINRVSFGLLSPSDLQVVDPKMPQSRRVMAVPFVGKDVPSRSSEFAHPDILIGLTVFAYRYEGIRQTDLKRIVAQLKSDFSKELEPRTIRPAALRFKKWVLLALSRSEEKGKGKGASVSSDDAYASMPVLPLPLFQPNDSVQIARLFSLVRHLPNMLHYYMRQLVFPVTMNFQKLKVSACGHELGSDILFAKRIGFSGTPSNLLPQDLGECQYEPGSDGHIMHVLSSDKVVSVSRHEEWSAKSLLLELAQAYPPFHALIDTGALITGMDNAEVAHFLLGHLPEWMEGVVYLDRSDRQMILVRSSSTTGEQQYRSVLLAQCGIPPERRFCFYDQVHTTGMDIKQAPNVRAVVTIGKDMTFRDYAQGSFRMRGIGKGQTIHLYLIAEVENLIKQTLKLKDADVVRPEQEVPAWLLINSMKMESLQFFQLGLQEVNNVWRKRALRDLIQDVDDTVLKTANVAAESSRLRRFDKIFQCQRHCHVNDTADSTAVLSHVNRLKLCINQFREVVDYSVEEGTITNEPFADKLRKMVDDNAHFADSEHQRERLENVVKRIEQVSCVLDESAAESGEDGADKLNDTRRLNLNAEVVHENEAEAEAEAEQEAEQEEQKMSAFTRDDEQANPWETRLLGNRPNLPLQKAESSGGDGDETGDDPFYEMSSFRAHPDMPNADFPSNLILTDNFFRPQWCGMGDRRLKNVSVYMEWIPGDESAKKELQADLKQRMQEAFVALVAGGMDPTAAAIQAMQAAMQPGIAVAGAAEPGRDKGAAAGIESAKVPPPKECAESTIAGIPFVCALSLAEAESIRKILHSKQPILSIVGLALRTLDGDFLDKSEFYVKDEKGRSHAHSQQLEIGRQCLRYFNCDMYFNPAEIDMLETALTNTDVFKRRDFFMNCLRLRRRERNLWADTPLAKLFTVEEEWHLIPGRAALHRLRQAITGRKLTFTKLFGSISVQQDEASDSSSSAVVDAVTAIASASLSFQELVQIFRKADMPVSSEGVREIMKTMKVDDVGRVAVSALADVLEVPITSDDSNMDGEDSNVLSSMPQIWKCKNCTYANLVADHICALCGYGKHSPLFAPMFCRFFYFFFALD
jgi:hypothetical protein